MLPSSASNSQIALNRVTFGATVSDIQSVQQIGWTSWVAQQLAINSDDLALTQHLNAQTMPISYAAPAAGSTGTWAATNEPNRPLNYLNADVSVLWNLVLQGGASVAPAEQTRSLQEIVAASWIRNTHAAGQLREFMVDFWQNHFNIGKIQNNYATAALPIYDRAVIRPNVFGNFRQMLEAVATSTSMQAYLDNWLSTATQPNENYAREIIELHTLGVGAYLGIVPVGTAVPIGANGTALNYTDADVTQNSRALSGWTLANGQATTNKGKEQVTGAFVYNPAQHNTAAGIFMNVDLSQLTNNMAQGEKVLDILATHPSTANFVVAKLARRMFGDAPPQSVITRGVNAWTANASAPNQIAMVLEAMLLDGPEISTYTPVKIRRPYELLISMFRTTGMQVNAATNMYNALDVVTDGLFAWTAPNGRPDVNAYWQGAGAQMTAWNAALTFPAQSQIVTNLYNQTPTPSLSSATQIVEYWVGQMIGYEIPAMSALVTDQTGSSGVLAALKTKNPTTIETAFRRLVALITTTRDFVYR